MEKCSYQYIYKFIFNKLIDVNGVLSKDKIDYEIENTKKLLDTIGPEMFARILSVKSIEPLLDTEWRQMKRELELHFDVEMESGVLIQGDEQQKRDTSWWTSHKKQTRDGYYWDRYKIILNRKMPPEVVKVTDDDTDMVMNNIGDPSEREFSRYGMVVGHVQSGKTGNYSSLVCKAADAGYKFIVVISGSKNNLRNQTQVRINEAFVGVNKGTPVGVGKLGDLRKDYLPISLTTTEQDFNKQDADKNSQALNFDNSNTPIVMVIKKISPTLTNVISWLKTQYKNGVQDHAMLLIDDESDYASINTKDEQDPATINRLIRELLGCFKKSTYIAYTATPYANIFIDHEAQNESYGEDLFPKDFIYALDAPSNYLGARRVFIDESEKFLINISDFENSFTTPHSKHKSSDKMVFLPESLVTAINLFILNIAIRNLRGQRGNHNSMMIHMSRFKHVHRSIGVHVDEHMTNLRKEIISFGRLKSAIEHSKYIKSLKSVFESIHSSVEFSWESVVLEVCECIESVIIREVHSNSKIPLEYRDDIATNAIVIGGESLSRGYTLEGLSVSYFIRTTVYYDTLMQMARWFGYRVGYEDLCKVFLTEDATDNYKNIIMATEDLFEDFKIMADAKRTPYEFGLAVKQYPDSALQVTARNKQKNVSEFYLDMKLDGMLKETARISDNYETNQRNVSAIGNILRNVDADVKSTQVESHYVWKNVSKDHVYKFLKEFEIVKSDYLGLSSRMPIGFIMKYVKERETNWDVALYSGSSESTKQVSDSITISKARRQIVSKSGHLEISNRLISIGNSESIALDAENRKLLGSNRKSIRKCLERPLLMLHIFNTEVDQSAEYPAFGISFPGDILSEGSPIRLKINTVYLKNLNKELEEEAEIDD